MIHNLTGIKGQIITLPVKKVFRGKFRLVELGPMDWYRKYFGDIKNMNVVFTELSDYYAKLSVESIPKFLFPNDHNISSPGWVCFMEGAKFQVLE